MKSIITILLSLTVGVRAHAAMVRVVEVQDARTLVIERGGSRQSIRLAGITIVDEMRASELLRWTVGTSWVLVEKQPNGEHLVFRSPDALFINRELVLRGYARATLAGIEPVQQLNVTYLGQWNPPGPQVSGGPRSPENDTSTGRRSSGSRAPKTRTPRARSAGRAAKGERK